MDWKTKLFDYVLLRAGSIVSAIVIFIVGILVARWLAMAVLRALEKKNIEPPVKMLINRFIRLLVVGFATITALGTCGIDVTTLVAGIGIAGVGLGLAMQGVLGNLVAGLTIIFTKPFRVGEFVEIHGINGQVGQIELFSTTLIAGDLSRVIIPNRKIVGEILHNYGTIRQLSLTVGVGYGTDLNKMQATVREILAQNPRVLKDPAPAVGISTLADSSIVVAVKPWTNLADFGSAQAELNQAIIEKFRSSEIQIPFPQREVRLLNAKDVA